MTNKLIRLTVKAPAGAIALLVVLVTAMSPAHAQYPEKEIRLVVPYAPGGSATTSARLFADKLAKELDQKVYVDNKGGASGAIGASFVADAPADGYTLLYSSAAMMTVNPALFGEQLKYKVSQFAPIGLANTFASVLFVNKDFPAKNLKEFISYAKSTPGTITFGSAGPGSSGHLWGELLKNRANIDIRHIPYKGTAPALIDVIGGRISFVVDAAVAGQEQLKAGNLRAIAVTSDSRIATLPDLPTFAESGLKGFEPLNWYGIFGPAGTPKDVVKKINSAIAAVASDTDYKEKLMTLGMGSIQNSPEQLKARIESDSNHWGSVIKTAGISIQ
ncbi:MAG TPA: tripartite tricarboxylate transporter substrate binding protein [Eoetvoesiella sp.]